MIWRKTSLLPFLGVLLIVGISLAQGPKKDIGKDLPPSPEIKEDKPEQSPKSLGLPKVASLSVDVDLVDVDVSVTDSDNHNIDGLTKDQFKVYDDNVLQPITNFAQSEGPVTIAIMFEYGATFGNYRLPFQPAVAFINSLQPDDWGALVAYDRRTTILTDFTKNKDALGGGLEKLFVPRYPEVALYDSLYEVLGMMDNTDGRKAIVLLCSGYDTADFNTHSYPDLLKRTAATDTLIFAVSLSHLGAMGSTRLRGFNTSSIAQADNTLGSLAANTGGTAFFPQFVAEFPNIVSQVSGQLRYRYNLGFVPTDRKADGKFHKLRVEVGPIDLNHDGKPDKIKVHYKQGYNAAKP